MESEKLRNGKKKLINKDDSPPVVFLIKRINSEGSRTEQKNHRMGVMIYG